MDVLDASDSKLCAKRDIIIKKFDDLLKKLGMQKRGFMCIYREEVRREADGAGGREIDHLCVHSHTVRTQTGGEELALNISLGKMSAQMKSAMEGWLDSK